MGEIENVTPTGSRVGTIFKRVTGVAILVAAVVLGGPYGLRYYHHAMSHESTDDAFIDGHIVAVSPRVSAQVLRVHVTDNQHVKKGDLLVELDPRDFQVQLARARSAMATAGARQASARINVGVTQTTSSAAVTQAQSSLEVARSVVRERESHVLSTQAAEAQARAQVLAAQAAVAREKAQIRAAEADQRKASLDVRRYRQLYEKDELPRQQLDHAIAALQSASANLSASRQRTSIAEAQLLQAAAAERSAQQAVRIAQAQVESAQAQVQVELGRVQGANVAPQQVAARVSEVHTAGADVAQTRVAVQQAELQLSYCRIYAPADGRISRKAVEPGAYVQVGQALMALVPDDVWVVANFKETQLNHIRVGQKVDVHVDAYPGVSFTATVDSIQRGTGARFSVLPPENATGNYVKVVQRVPVKIVFDTAPDPRYALGPGMSVVPEVRIQSQPEPASSPR